MSSKRTALDSPNFAAPIRQILTRAIAPAIKSTIECVFTQPGPFPVAKFAPSDRGCRAITCNDRREDAGLSDKSVSGGRSLCGAAHLTWVDTVEKVRASLLTRNNRIVRVDFLNRTCAVDAHFESMLLRDPPKIFFRQHRPSSSVTTHSADSRSAFDSGRPCQFPIGYANAKDQFEQEWRQFRTSTRAARWSYPRDGPAMKR
jgi:hypothetical protein